MRTMANLDYTFMVAELRPLEGKFLDKFYELGPGRFRLKFGRDIILIELGVRLHKTRYLEEAPPATNFAMKIRKELKGRLLTSIKQRKKDRIVIFDFGGTRLVAEMFGQGNLVLVKEGKIAAVYSRKRWKGRALVPNSEYSFPESEPKTLQEIFAQNSPNAVGSELRALDIGMSYVREILKEARVEDSRPVDSLEGGEKEEIEKALGRLRSSLSPKVLYEGDAPKSFSLFGRGKEFPTLSEALDEFYGEPLPGEGETAGEDESRRLAKLLEDQESRLEELEAEEAQAKENAKFIYEHYGDFEKLISLYRSKGIGAIESLAQERGWKLDKKEKTLEMGTVK